MRLTVLITAALFVFSAVPGICFGQNKVVVIPLGADCPPGLTVCNGKCVDTNNNPLYCGNCNTDCGIGRFCVEGGCIGQLGDPCTKHGDCLVGGCLDNLCADVKLVFVTSQEFNGNLGGLTGADAKCQAAAYASGLPGIYKAWLSDSFQAPSSAWRFSQAAVPYVRVDGMTVAAHWHDLVSGDNLTNPINRDEYGSYLDAVVWTNTNPSGSVLDTVDHCIGWIRGDNMGFDPGGRTGRSTRADSYWTDDRAQSTCSSQHSIYCFGQ